MTLPEAAIIALAAVVGYLVGSLPTAGWLARARGIDLMSEGSGNPGANNALRTGGSGLAASVLLVEMAKGALLTLAGGAVAAGVGMVAAGVAGAGGNLYNLWYRLRGGKGLGITAGVLVVAWPLVVAPIVVVLALAAWLTRSTGGGTIVAVVALAAAGTLWRVSGLPVAWGVDASLLPALSVGLGLLITPKHFRDARFRRPSLSSHRGPGSPAHR